MKNGWQSTLQSSFTPARTLLLSFENNFEKYLKTISKNSQSHPIKVSVFPKNVSNFASLKKVKRI